MDPALLELYEGGAAEDEARVILRTEDGAELPANTRIIASFGNNIHTARVARGGLLELWNNDHVASVKAPRPISVPTTSANEEEAPTDAVENITYVAESNEGSTSFAPGLDLPEDGSGVVFGTCDWGLDFTHPNFRNADGSTRVLALWDQRSESVGSAPEPYGYGRVYTRAEIDQALQQPDPCRALGYHPGDANGAHGTHVVDIAVGNRAEPGSRVGVAPKADIVFVHLGNQRMGELANLGDSVTLLEGMDFVRKQAQGRPCVLHLSAGKTAGPHRGTTLLERAVDAMLAEPGLALVQSVGNYADSAMHAHARIGPNQKYELEWLIPARDRTPNELEIWYSGQDHFGVRLTSPQGHTFEVPLGQRQRIHIDGEHCGNFYHRRAEPNSGFNHIDIFLYARAPGGRWKVTILGNEVVDGRMHAWIERDAKGRYQSRFPRHTSTSLYTTNTICNSFRAIAVGAHDATQATRPATVFSSRGPTADGRQKPELSAPGYRIVAARSIPLDGWQGEPKLCVKSGTSMAAPWVSGTVVLMMQAAGRLLTVHEIRGILIGTCDPAGGPNGRSSTRLGYGYLNVQAAVAAARALGKTAAVEPSPLQREVTESETGEFDANPEAGLRWRKRKSAAAPAATRAPIAAVAPNTAATPIATEPVATAAPIAAAASATPGWPPMATPIPPAALPPDALPPDALPSFSTLAQSRADFDNYRIWAMQAQSPTTPMLSAPELPQSIVPGGITAAAPPQAVQPLEPLAPPPAEPELSEGEDFAEPLASTKGLGEAQYFVAPHSAFETSNSKRCNCHG